MYGLSLEEFLSMTKDVDVYDDGVSRKGNRKIEVIEPYVTWSDNGVDCDWFENRYSLVVSPEGIILQFTQTA